MPPYRKIAVILSDHSRERWKQFKLSGDPQKVTSSRIYEAPKNRDKTRS